MRIISIRPDSYRAEGGARTLALFDVAITDGIHVHNIALREMPDGKRRVASPNARGSRVITFTRDTAREITQAAEAAFLAMGASKPNDRTAN